MSERGVDGRRTTRREQPAAKAEAQAQDQAQALDQVPAQVQAKAAAASASAAASTAASGAGGQRTVTAPATTVATGLRTAAGLALGAAAALLEAVAALAALPVLPFTAWPRGRRAVAAVAGRLVGMERWRLERFLGVRVPPYGQPRTVPYLVARWPIALLGGVVLGCAVIGLAYLVFALVGWLFVDLREPVMVVLGGLGGLLLLFLATQGIGQVARREGELALRMLGPRQADALEARIAELAASRAEIMDVVHEERRRIERDLHDGVQQRLVALGMLIGRARRSQDPDRAAELLLQAHEESRRALAELREVAWRVHPAILDQAGLRTALEAVAERGPLPVRLGYAVARDLPKAVETAAYFVVSEAVTNVVKHAGASGVDVEVLWREGELDVRVRDDGRGGADPGGSGLAGLASRVAALDGRFAVDSPSGGPTEIRAVLPCA
ncbi:sensor histidine kinase [Streptomyces sp. NPDC012769]|uniref:sensor histidine kinase n=1 Tax=Streptomyces sp. NPDC012769 TaxID=3364848 RepID=UPI0036B226AC